MELLASANASTVGINLKKTKKVRAYPLPPEHLNPYTLTAFVAVGSDGTVCFDDTQNRRVYFLDPETGKVTGYDAYPGWKFDRETERPGDGVPHVWRLR